MELFHLSIEYIKEPLPTRGLLTTSTFSMLGYARYPDMVTRSVCHSGPGRGMV